MANKPEPIVWVRRSGGRPLVAPEGTPSISAIAREVVVEEVELEVEQIADDVATAEPEPRKKGRKHYEAR